VGSLNNWKQVAASARASAAIKTDGTLWTWGKDAYGKLGAGTNGVSRSSPGTTVGGGTNWKLVEISGEASYGIKTDGTLWSWGYNGNSNLGTGNNVSRSSPGTVIGGITSWKKVVHNHYYNAFCLAISDQGGL
jgi:alpha-tubulin suppressor-like RCC1 family protein